ncbi:MAG: phosphodiester glycosidase family protein, partial [Clostridia bacterium]|nr:phosphodiester glycosidase family protein [Clostridia bacterium]
MKRKRAGFPPGGLAVMFALLALLLVPLVPSSGNVDEMETLIASSEYLSTPVDSADGDDLQWDEGEDAISTLADTPIGDENALYTPFVNVNSSTDATPFPQTASVPLVSPASSTAAAIEISASPSPTPVIKLSMSDFSGGGEVKRENYDSATKTYHDDSITVTGYREKHDGTLYYVADVTIAHASQFRTAIAGTPKNSARAGIVKLSRRVNAVVSINGDFYQNRSGGYLVRQGVVLSKSLSNDLDLLVVDYEGDLHCISAADKKKEIAALQGNIYQCFCFGPVLIRDGELVKLPKSYPFGIDDLNPRAAIGQLGPRHYLLVVASGRSDDSRSITVETLQKYMQYKGCIQAFNLDG